MKIKQKIPESAYNWPIRRFIRTTYPHLSQAAIHKALRTGDIKINNKKIDIDYLLQLNDELMIFDRLTEPLEPTPVSTEKQYEFLKKRLIDQNENFWVFNKPAGLPCQGGTNINISLDYLLTGWMQDYNSTPHLVHRLDKYTTGVCLVATNPISSYQLTSLFKNRKIHKTYIALCHNINNFKTHRNHTGEFKTAIDHKQALTEYKILGVIEDKLLIEFYPVTGRKHQIRIHCAEHNIPICGDNVYYPETTFKNMYLHAYKIQNDTETPLIKPFEYEAPLPAHLASYEIFFK